ncbi:hypothetical protein N7495_002634 [Penicillium taxi]|uniref:uncharacterized protein n=1 Tax=Penicillium taxi TaxID=168475 RepID=UPI002544F86B|nr:uncharacterized protein N7495_002634 [Penicillium taxi]KAJ5902106.1 hypothetical protein N7495_002634 [Penicillium taxi]
MACENYPYRVTIAGDAEPVGAVLFKVGSHSALRSSLKQNQTQLFNFSLYFPTFMRGKNDVYAFLSAIETLHGLNVPVDLIFEQIKPYAGADFI